MIAKFFGAAGILTAVAALFTATWRNRHHQASASTSITPKTVISGGSGPVFTSQKKRKYHAATWISLVAAVTAIAAAVISYLQVNVAKEQGIAADQQQLLTLTTTIGQQLAQGAAAETQPSTTPGATSNQAKSNAQIVLTTELTSEGEAAAVLISKLHGNGVAGIEYIQAGEALAEGDNIGQALTYFQDAVNAPPHAAGTRADALRSEGVIYYALGRPIIGHNEMMLAVKVYADRSLELTKSSIANSIAQSYLADAAQQVNINSCKIAAADMKAAAKALSPAGASGTNATNTAFILADGLGYLKHCKTSK
jgi:hypothetical protein